MTAKFNADILARLGELSREELQAALAAIRADADAFQGQAATPENIEAYNELLGHARTLRHAYDALTTAAATQVSQFAEMGDLTDVGNTDGDNAEDTGGDQDGAGADSGDGSEGSGTDDNADSASTEGDDSANTDDNSSTAGDQDGGDSATDGDSGTTQEGSPVTASARRPLGGVNRNTAPAIHPVERVTLSTEVAGGVDGFESGSRLDRRTLAKAFAAKGRAVAGRNIQGYERYRVATVHANYPESRKLGFGADYLANIERVEQVVDEARSLSAAENAERLVSVRSGGTEATALTAAGLCAPLETLYDIRTIGDIDRPVRDALTRFQADRGGIQYRPALNGVAQTGGIAVWTPTNDEDMDPADPDTLKTCVEIDCPGILTAEVDAIYQCLTFSNMSSRFDPEQMDSSIRAQAIAHARFAENRLLTQLVDGSKTLYSARELGATRDILFTLDKMVAYYRNVHRYNREIPFRWIAPAWALNLMRADITRQMVGDGLQALAVTDQQLMQWLAQRNINATFHLDGIDPADITVPDPDVPVPAQFYTLATTNSPVPAFPTALSTLLFAEGDWLYLDGGTLDLGVVRDSTLNSQNRFQTFSESFETTANRGIESIHLVIPALPTGESAATADTTP